LTAPAAGLRSPTPAPVAEVVDAADSKSVGRKAVLVRVRPGAPSIGNPLLTLGNPSQEPRFTSCLPPGCYTRGHGRHGTLSRPHAAQDPLVLARQGSSRTIRFLGREEIWRSLQTGDHRLAVRRYTMARADMQRWFDLQRQRKAAGDRLNGEAPRMATRWLSHADREAALADFGLIGEDREGALAEAGAIKPDKEDRRQPLTICKRL
jgi:hypothetical protein